ncbi:MAG: HlyD family efflux transporter periplasmic adaptor subunit [bacterium]
MKNLFNKIKQFIIDHKTASVIVLIIILIIGYWTYGKLTSTTGEVRYVTAQAEKATIIATITGTGQVSSSTQIDIKPKASGEIIYLPVQSGQKVGSGTLIAKIDTKDAQKTIRDAETSLESAKLSLEKLKIQDSADNMNADLAKSYDDGFNTVSNVFLDMPTIMTGLNDMLYKTNNSSNGQWSVDWYANEVVQKDSDDALAYKKKVNDSYALALKAFNATFDDYKKASRNSDNATIEALIRETYNTTKIVADSIKVTSNYIDFVKSSMSTNNFTIPQIFTTHQASLNNYTSETNSHLLTLLSITTSIKNYKDAFLNSDLDVQSSQLSVKQRENGLQDAKDNLANYYIYTPFGGTLSNVAVKKTDSVSSGTTIATLITDKQLAELSLNEVDIAKISTGQKATLTFDAIPDLTISGKVAEIDSIGTVSSGVVNYTVKISFDTSDIRVKPGMSVNATIITDIKQDVLTVPNSAIKTQNGSSYVETFDTALADPATGVQGSPSLTLPNKKTVTTGISNDTVTEITSGLNEGDIAVAKTITGVTATAKATSTKSILGGMGGGH